MSLRAAAYFNGVRDIACRMLARPHRSSERPGHSPIRARLHFGVDLMAHRNRVGIMPLGGDFCQQQCADYLPGEAAAESCASPLPCQ